MVKDKKQMENEQNVTEDKKTNLKPIQNLTALNLTDTDGFMCDIETGICGPVNDKEEESK